MTGSPMWKDFESGDSVSAEAGCALWCWWAAFSSWALRAFWI